MGGVARHNSGNQCGHGSVHAYAKRKSGKHSEGDRKGLLHCA